MGLLSSLLPIIGSIGGNLIAPGIGGQIGGALGGALAGGSGGSKQTGTQTTTQQQTLDPRIANAIFGTGGTGADGGILGRNMAFYDRQQDPLMAQYGTTMQNYLGNTGQDMGAMRQAATGLLSPMQAPQMQAASMAAPGRMDAARQGVAEVGSVQQNVAKMAPASQTFATMGAANMGNGAQASATNYDAARINAPSQNNLGLAPAYQDMVYGAAGANPYLTGAIGKGINQSKNAFDSMQADSTRNLLENVLPSIGSNAILAGQYGGSRQGITEGRALGDFGREQQRAINQFGQNNTDAAVAAQAGAYDADRSRALSAMSGLGAQQYGVAQQQASMDTQAARDNAAAANAASLFNAGSANNAGQFNAGLQQQAAGANMGAQNTALGSNADRQQQADAANMGAYNSAFAGDANRSQGAHAANAAAYNNAWGNNAQFDQQANAANFGATQDANRTNAGLQQNANQANLQSQLSTNGLNSNNAQSGIGALSGLLGTAAQAGGNQDSYALNQASKVNSLLSPYVGLGSGQTSSQPLYQNQGAGVLGGAIAGSQLAGQLGNVNWGNMFGQSRPPPPMVIEQMSPGLMPTNFNLGY